MRICYRIYLSVELLSVFICSALLATDRNLKWLYQFSLPPAKSDNSNCSICSSFLGVVYFILAILMDVYIRTLQRQNQEGVHVPVCMSIEKSKIFTTGQQAGDPGNS